MDKSTRNQCIGCKFADTRYVGSDKPCCTYPGKLEFNQDGQCLKKR